MPTDHIAGVAKQLELETRRVDAAAGLLVAGATIPFIARYRKEVTGGLDEVQLAAVRDELSRREELDRRRETVLSSLEKHGHLDEVLTARVAGAETLAELEDIYLPFRPKRRTRATRAREMGLEPLALKIFAQQGSDPQATAAGFIDPARGVETVEQALSGARDIVAEMVNENGEARARMREFFTRRAVFRSRVATGKEEAGAKYRDYFDCQEPASAAPSHRILAMRRGEREDFLNLSLQPPVDDAIGLLEDLFVRGDGPDSRQVAAAVRDGYKRLMARSLEAEMRLETKDRADVDAIRVFAANLRQLLLAPPLGRLRVLGVDPGYRTGCKLACLDRQGRLLHHETIYPHTGGRGAEQARERSAAICREYEIEAVAVGNGTAGRETEAFFRSLPPAADTLVVMVDESGASVYSASEAARDEFPDLDLTVRGAISIGRRLMDPLSELVKIDPKAIGVGQYQHDVDQPALKHALDDVVVSCVNAVGVDANRSSARLLSYVSGLGPHLARAIVAHREAKGSFRTRAAFKDVPRLGPKAFEQCAGFLRIADGDNPLDASAVHPESYPVVYAMAGRLDCTVQDLMSTPALRRRIDPREYVSDTVGEPTLRDILRELEKPGRDPRKTFEPFAFASGVETLGDLEPGMRLPGIVTNVTAFGAFVDVGVHQDGLVHISQLADRFVRDPSQVVRVHQRVRVRVLQVDQRRGRISLSMRTESGPDDEGRRAKSGGGKPSRRPAKPVNPSRTRRKPFHNPLADALGKLEKK